MDIFEVDALAIRSLSSGTCTTLNILRPSVLWARSPGSYARESAHFTDWRRGPWTRTWGSRGSCFHCPFHLAWALWWLAAYLAPHSRGFCHMFLSTGSLAPEHFRLSTIISFVTFIAVKWAYGLFFFPPVLYPWSEIKLHINQLGFPDTLLWASFVALWCLVGHAWLPCPFRIHCVCKGSMT